MIHVIRGSGKDSICCFTVMTGWNQSSVYREGEREGREGGQRGREARKRGRDTAEAGRREGGRAREKAEREG